MISNMSSKILQMLILPIITASLAMSEYGYYDLIITSISLVTPIVTFQLIEGMFRFMFNASEEDQKKTMSTVTAFIICGFVVLFGFFIILRFVAPEVKYPFLIYLNYVSSIVFNYMQKLARCMRKNRIVAVAGVVNTIVMLACQAIFLLFFKMGVDGMLIANAVSYFVAAGYFGLNINVRKYLGKKFIDKSKFVELIKYSIPLVPNSVGWWFVTSSNRYIIAWFLGAAANGIYSIAGKFSQLLTLVTTVFQLAWQESAIAEANSEERDKFYTDVFNSYMKLLLCGYLVVLPLIKLLIPVLLDKTYQSGWLYNPVLLLGAVFSAFSQFYGNAYLVFKKTVGAFSTTMIAAALNVGIGIVLIKRLGLFAPALGTALAFLAQWIIRVYQTRNYFKVKIDVTKLVFLLVMMTASTIVYYLDGVVCQIASMSAGVVVFSVMNWKMILPICKKMLKRQ